jgi:hypothetical protein
MKPEHIEIAEQIARDASCAQGEFGQRVLSIIPYLTDVCDRASLVGVERPEDVARVGAAADVFEKHRALLPPYGDTSLAWDRRCEGWLEVATQIIKPNGSMWVFGSMRLFVETGERFRQAGWRYAQDVVWEKQNGSGFSADRFKRVHECAVQFYLATARWTEIYNEVQRVPRTGADKSGARRAHRGHHVGEIRQQEYQDDGTRIMRSVIKMNNMHGRAIHPISSGKQT